MTIPVKGIRRGDTFRYDDGVVLWTALTHAHAHPERPGFVRVKVHYIEDDITKYNEWPSDTTLPIDRAGT